MHDNAAIPESVAMVVYDGVATFEIGVTSDVFGTAYAPDFGVPWYRLAICAATPSVVLDAGPRMEVPDDLTAMRTAGTVVVLPTRQPDQVPVAVLGAGTVASVQVVPFHVSLKAAAVWVACMSLTPTAMHQVALTQLMPVASGMGVAAEDDGVAAVVNDKVVPFHWFPKMEPVPAVTECEISIAS